jgi:hypothetical protein
MLNSILAHGTVEFSHVPLKFRFYLEYAPADFVRFYADVDGLSEFMAHCF